MGRSVVVVAVVLAATALLASLGAGQDAPKSPGFEEITERSGIYFKHGLLWNEQGDRFKMNHYEHGSGVLVADVNGDGRMDVYLLNQDGPNALYVQRGDGSFVDTAARAGVTVVDRVSSGGAFGDVDNDGDADLYVTTIRAGNILFLNDGKGLFTDVTAKAGVGVVAHSTTAAFLDVDNDGFLDLYVGNQADWTTGEYDKDLRYYVGQESAMHSAEGEPDVLFRNGGDGTFVDATDAAGIINDPVRLAPPAMRHPSSAGGDENGGGMHGMPHEGGAHAPKPKFWTGDCAIGDYDDDGLPDLYVTNIFGSDVLYRNAGKGRLAAVTPEVLPRTSFGSFGARWADLDNNGLLDLYVVDMHSDMWAWPPLVYPVDRIDFFARYSSQRGPVQSGGGGDPKAPVPNAPWVYGNTCFLNQGDGRFTEACEDLGLENFWPWGVVTADFDRDGWTDILVAAGMSWPWDYTPNFFYFNEKGGHFREAAREVGIEPRVGGEYLDGLEMHGNTPEIASIKRFARSTRAAAAVDLDDDGAVDLILQNWNDRATVLKNRLAPGAHWIGFSLAGKKTNRDAVGAKVRVTAAGKTRVQMVQGAGGYLEQSDPRLVFGLGEAQAIEKAEVVWPGGSVQVLSDIKIDRYNRVEEK